MDFQHIVESISTRELHTLLNGYSIDEIQIMYSSFSDSEKKAIKPYLQQRIFKSLVK